MNYELELSRNNVTPAQFFAMIRFECKKRNIDFYLDREDFEKPATEYSSSYSVIGNKKISHFSSYRDKTKRKLHSWSQESSAEDAPCKAETNKQFAYDYQIYILNFDGSCYNEICEFTFDNDKKGHGYYYTVNKEAREVQKNIN